ncbi:hypothetical protein [Bacillus sp. B-jedd]|uniref:hypothetical protein n=1 Tax=Bacillus sp. B-jedd TaxID=1476857 RepID=UPI0005155F7E|nr:hypothetical protein [Bacillus sp. B-jedd]CEG26495.1 hypothetical protein BN1002_01342 [Bacillus sp. B-jedd]
MNRSFKVILGLLFFFTLTGCFGENYDFSPPTVSVINPNGSNEQEELAEANIEWEYDKKYNKETEDLVSLARKQNKMYFNPGQRVEISMENGDFNPNGIMVSVWQNEKKIDLKYQKNDQSFYLPKEKGEYIIVVDLHADSGDAQYVGNIVMQ